MLKSPSSQPIYQATVQVHQPYRLDLTVDALRRIPANVIDVVTADGRYLRALIDGPNLSIISVQQRNVAQLDVRITGQSGPRLAEVVKTMLGTEVDLRPWYRRVQAFRWLDRLATRFGGVKPPRYPDLWEALCHGILFQQLSIPAAAAIMQRMVKRFSMPIEHAGVVLYPFPRPEALLQVSLDDLGSLGLSRMKASYIRGAAESVLTGKVSERRLEGLPTDDAAAELCRYEVSGLGALP